MYSPTLRSNLRTRLKQAAQNYSLPIEPATISKDVTEQMRVYNGHVAKLRSEELITVPIVDWLEAIHQLAYGIALEEFKNKTSKAPGYEQQELKGLGVPEKHCNLILLIGHKSLYVPSESGFMPLAGKERMTRPQLWEAHLHLKTMSEDIARRALYVKQLWETPGYYKSR